jgi:hypothetical protein
MMHCVKTIHISRLMIERLQRKTSRRHGVGSKVPIERTISKKDVRRLSKSTSSSGEIRPPSTVQVYWIKD